MVNIMVKKFLQSSKLLEEIEEGLQSQIMERKVKKPASISRQAYITAAGRNFKTDARSLVEVLNAAPALTNTEIVSAIT